MLRNISSKDVPSIIKIHRSELSEDFLPSLGKGFLTLLYEKMLEINELEIIVSEELGKINGFIIGSYNFDLLFKQIVKNNFISFSLKLIPIALSSPKILISIIDTIIYPGKVHNVPKAELVIIAVSSSSQGKGIGKKLVKELEKRFKKHGIKKYKVSTTSDKIGSNAFYRALGFKYKTKFNLYRKNTNLYTREIK